VTISRVVTACGILINGELKAEKVLKGLLPGAGCFPLRSCFKMNQSRRRAASYRLGNDYQQPSRKNPLPATQPHVWVFTECAPKILPPPIVPSPGIDPWPARIHRAFRHLLLYESRFGIVVRAGRASGAASPETWPLAASRRNAPCRRVARSSVDDMPGQVEDSI
jgi:hypothetical protein